MIRIPGMLMIGSTGRNVGKTEFACAVIRRFAGDHDIAGIKVTAIEKKDGSCPRGGAGCGVCSSLTGDYCITEETAVDTHKDTSRLLAAGASRVLWLRVMKTHLAEGLEALFDMLGRDTITVCESNSLRSAAIPGVFVMARNSGPGRCKASALSVLEHADRTVTFDGKIFDIDFSSLGIIDGRWMLRENAAAIILAGGESKRMRQDKSMLQMNGRPLIEHLASQLRGHFEPVLISANEPDKYAFLSLKVIQDKIPGHGPLMGVRSALSASPNDVNLVTACDIPDADLPLARRMIREADGYDAVVPRVANDFLEPLFAVYRKSVVDAMDDLLGSGERRIRAVFDRCHTHYIDLVETSRVKNLNTMADYRAYVAGQQQEAGLGR